MYRFREQLFKVLSRNDTGETGGHQSGISIPKVIASSSIFPKMSKDILNPRKILVFIDEAGKEWNFPYIYYNDKYHGKPLNKCHDEYRLTCTTEYIRDHNIRSGDQIWFAIDNNGQRNIGFLRAGQTIPKIEEEEDGVVIIKIRSWTNIKKSI